MSDAYSMPRRRRWPLVLVVILVVFGGLWAGAWYYGAGVAARTIDGWKTREAKAGRVYTCANQTIGGFPFGIDIRCADPGADFRSNQPPVALRAKDIIVTASVWQPTVLTTDFVGPMTVAEPGRETWITVTWQRAQTQVHGLPTSPEDVSIKVEQPLVNRTGDSQNLFKADRLDLDGHLLSGSVQDHPVIEAVLKFVAATAPYWHPAVATPIDADITAVLTGLRDFSPKPWRARFRELQAAGGKIEITKARVQQRDTIAVASGTLGLSPGGRLNGELRLTVANLESLMPTLGLDRMLSQDRASPQLNKTFSALDRIMPGLGNMARQNAGPMITAGINIMGEPAELEGKRAVTLPLRFEDGMASLGSIKLGMTPALF
jgi:hypothetical protein